MSNGIMFICPLSLNSQTAIQDLFEIVVGATVVAIIHEVHVSQETEFGDAAAEMLDIEMSRYTGTVTSGTGGSAGAVQCLGRRDITELSTVEINNFTTQMGGTQEVIAPEAWHVAGGFHYVPLPESRLVISPTDGFAVRLDIAPDDSLDLRGYMVFEELGG